MAYVRPGRGVDLVHVAAFGAALDRLGDQASLVAGRLGSGSIIRRVEDHPVDQVASPLVIQVGARAELADRQETRAL